MPIDFDRIDELVAEFAANGRQPGIGYGIVLDGALAHSGGVGEREVGGQRPDAGTVFRIASMSKSFTASVIMSLRDEGTLALDDPVAGYVPELRGWPADARRITIRNLLTMTAGFPTDDPWGDRQQGLPLDEFGELLAAGVSLAWAPGVRFDYSNLGYAILGRLIANVTGRPFKDVVRDRFLSPLGMTSTGYEAGEFAAGRLAVGYRRAPAGWQRVPYDPYGAFAPMGGVYSTVADLTRWVAGFAAAYPPGAGAADHPLAAASRREMQLPQVAMGSDFAYGFGLFVREDGSWGRIVSHSGGYPGFGTNMCWHPATGTGAIALANGTYAPTPALTRQLLHTALAAVTKPAVPLARGPWPETLAAVTAVDGLLRDWDDAAAARLFTANVALDAPYTERRDLISRVRDRIGDFTPDEGRPAESDTPAHRRWWLTGERGTVQVQIQLSPQRPPRVQSLAIAVPPATDSPLGRTMERVVMWLNNDERDWPAELAVTAGSDVARWVRRLRMAAAWAGACRLDAWRAGDGETASTADLAGEHARVRLSAAVEPATGLLREVSVTGF